MLCFWTVSICTCNIAWHKIKEGGMVKHTEKKATGEVSNTDSRCTGDNKAALPTNSTKNQRLLLLY